jgi:5-methylcytosine-specific restriction endonuclease McrA
LTFSDETQRDVRRRAHGVCECTMAACPHFGRCRSKGVEFHHKKAVAAGGTEEATNAQLLCTSCHQRTHGTSGGIGRL